MTKIVAISDTHNRYNKITIPECDILISCGDYSFQGSLSEVKNFHKWLNKQPAKNIISVQGNHERGVEAAFDVSKQIALEECPRVHFIDEGLVEIEGLKIWCSAITPFFCNWAWNRFRGPEIKAHWDKIPTDIDILVTHGPPHKILDVVSRGNMGMENVGCEDLFNKILQIPTLKHHFFGHIHGSYGHKAFNGVDYWIVSICGEDYRPTNLPVLVDISK